MIYLDNAATTRPYEEVLSEVKKTALDTFGNPSSLHRLGSNASAKLQLCREKIAELVGVDASWVTFTSGATEANQTVLKCGTRSPNKKRNHIIMTAIEHSSNIAAIPFLKEKGFEVEIIQPDRYGSIVIEDLIKKVRPETEMVSIIGVHNELGTIHDIQTISQNIKSVNPNTLLHVDAVQWFGKLPLNALKLNADYLTFSGHKLNATRGVGGIIKSPKAPLKPLIDGGGQEKRMRSGTENLPAIAGLVKAIEMIQAKDVSKLIPLQKKIHKFAEESENLTWIGQEPGSHRSPFINLIAVKEQKSEVIIHKLEEKNIFISSGSACSEKAGKSHTSWNFLNLEKKWLDGILRNSFSLDTNEEDVVTFIDELRKLT